MADENVKAPNLFERAKEEIEAIWHAEISHDHQKETHGMRNDIDENTLIHNVKAPNVFERAKEEIEALVQAIPPKKESQRFLRLHEEGHSSGRETHGMRDDIDENTSIDDVRGPNVVERAKEELEALIQTFYPKKESSNSVSLPKKEGGFGTFIATWLENVCSPLANKRD